MFTQINASKKSCLFLQPKFKILSQSSINNYYYEVIGLSKRLYVQIKRRPSNLLAGIIQPLIWLTLFGALFQNITINFQTPYSKFLNTGIITFTSFTSAMNAGLPIIFDREFGFLNRLLISPLLSRYSILISSLISITLITLFQTNIVILFNHFILNYHYNIKQSIYFFLIIIFLTIIIGNFSICLAFILPGHIEFLATLLIINLPILFSSTALAPIALMPHWLKIITYFNPITYAIELLRSITTDYFTTTNNLYNLIISTNCYKGVILFTVINCINFCLSRYIITYKCE